MATRMTIDEVLDEFLDDQRRRLTATTYRKYEDVIGLLRESLNRTGYMALTPEEELRWRDAYEAGNEDAFTAVIGPERILEHYDEFLGYFMISKVMAEEVRLRAASTVTKRLAAWLDEHGHADPGDVDGATRAARAAGRDLPSAKRLADLLYRWTESCEAWVGEDDEYVDEYLRVERVEPGRLWFERGFGPVPVPEEASALARPGWTINVVLVRAQREWHLVEVGFVYP